MCGRVVVYVDIVRALRHDLRSVQAHSSRGRERDTRRDESARYNLGPAEWSKASDDPIEALPIIALDASGNYALKPAYWQFIPSYIDSLDAAKTNTKYSMYNIRIEEIAPTYRKAWSQRRALALVDGVIEWCGEKGKRRAHLLRRRDGAPLALAAAWQRWRLNAAADAAPTSSGDERIVNPRDGLLTASVAVGGADAWWTQYSAGEKRKERMPRILLPEVAERFLDPDLTEASHIRDLLDRNAFPSDDLLEAVEIDAKKVNNPYYDGPDCVAPLSAA